jgi:hypothetical protein
MVRKNLSVDEKSFPHPPTTFGAAQGQAPWHFLQETISKLSVSLKGPRAGER